MTQKLNQVPDIKDLQSKFPELLAILWDMDGTLVNTELLHAQAVLMILDQYNPRHNRTAYSLEHDFFGETDHTVFQTLNQEGLLLNLNWDEFLNFKNSFFLKILSQTAVSEFFPKNIHRLIDQIKKLPLKIGLVTSSEKLMTQAILKKIDLDKIFDIILTREDTVKNKPDPMPYLTAMQKLQILPKNVLIFEDSPSGLKSAEASGANVIQVAWHISSFQNK